MSDATAEKSVTLDAIRARWEERQRAFLDELRETHDFGYCTFHGFWKLGPKGGPVVVATCPLNHDDLERYSRGGGYGERGEDIVYEGYGIE